jgi:hypothetical protein
MDVHGRREVMDYDADACNGQSGSPIWIEKDGKRYLVGILTKMGTGKDVTTNKVVGNSAVRITQEVFDQISLWLEAAMENPWLHEAGESERLELREEQAEAAPDQHDLEVPPQAAEEALGSGDELAQAETVDVPGAESSYTGNQYDTPLEPGLSEHQVPPGRTPAPWAQGIDPFPLTPTVAFIVNDRTMLAGFSPVKAASTVNHLCAALVDLTGNPLMPPYVGMNDDEMVFAGSMLKITAMYAAFALRAQVQAFVTAAAASGAPVIPPDITAEIEAAWRPKLLALFPTRPTQSFGNKQAIDFPKLTTIFDFLPSGKVEFAGTARALTDVQLDTIGEFGGPKGGFHDWMRVMMRWSNNAAASRCIGALGYVYLNGVLDQAGLFDATNNNGLWLSADYAGHDWVATKAEKDANAAGQLLTARWATSQGRRQSNVTATAAQAARLLTLMAQDRLVDAAASLEMRTLMQSAIKCVVATTKCGIGSYVQDALMKADDQRAQARAPVRRSFTALAAKKGFGDDSSSHECAIVERTVNGQQLRYVVVGLGSLRDRARRDLSELFVQLDDVIVGRHP